MAPTLRLLRRNSSGVLKELYDAIVPGNQTPWKKYFADDCIFSDEKGRTLDKTKLIADITPLPAGYTGSIKIENVQSRIVGDTAVFSYDCNESETIFGQKVTARYHTTDTWLNRNGEWQIIASQAHRYYEDPRSETPTRKNSPTTSAPTSLRLVKREQLSPKATAYSSNAKGRRKNCFPETSDLFFRKGVEGRIFSAAPPTAKSMPSLTVGTMKMFSGSKQNDPLFSSLPRRKRE